MTDLLLISVSLPTGFGYFSMEECRRISIIVMLFLDPLASCYELSRRPSLPAWLFSYETLGKKKSSELPHRIRSTVLSAMSLPTLLLRIHATTSLRRDSANPSLHLSIQVPGERQTTFVRGTLP